MDHPNLIFFGVDSLSAKRMSMYGYGRLNTPHISEFFSNGAVFENCFSPSIPTTPGYASMLTGMDCFSTNIVALRHIGGIADGIKTLPEILSENGYETSCVGYEHFRGFDNYFKFAGWGSWAEGRSRKAENLNEAALPELARLAGNNNPFMLFMRHMDPHSPYLPPEPFDRMFYQGDEFDKKNKSLEPVYNFKPFADYVRSWFPPGCSDAEYIAAQYDSAIAYMDACVRAIFEKIKNLGLMKNTVVVFTADHGETLCEHDCFFDHHGLYETNLRVPLAFWRDGIFKSGARFGGICCLKDVTPTVLSLMGIKTEINFDGRDLSPLFYGSKIKKANEIYLTEATWMRKHGLRTPEWKYIEALEPDFHYFPPEELYDLINDPDEKNDLAAARPEVVKKLKTKMRRFIKKREIETGRTAPIYTNTDWSGHGRTFESSDDAYNTLKIGDPAVAKKLNGRNFERIPFKKP